MLLKRARTAYWKKWAAKHEYEELKEGTWLEPTLKWVTTNLLEKSATNHECEELSKGVWLDPIRD